MEHTYENAAAGANPAAAQYSSLSFGGDGSHSTNLRDYQVAAVNAALEAISAGQNTVIRAATGAGKSLIISAIAGKFTGRVLVLCHRQELLEQNRVAYENISGSSSGIYAAAIRKDLPETHRVIFGTIATVANAIDLFRETGLVIVDECHLVPPDGEGRNRLAKVLRGIPATRLGLSATPYRLGDGLVFGSDTFFEGGLSFQISASQLLKDGYLSPLVGVVTAHEVDTSVARTRCGDFVMRDLAEISTDEETSKTALIEAIGICQGRKKIIVFGVSVFHCEILAETLIASGERAASIHGELSSADRKKVLAAFASGEIRWLINCDLLTTGFDAPDIDGIVLLRPTQSKALHVQMLGRGMRLAPSKVDCLVVDFAGNLQRHGNIDGMITQVEKSLERVKLDNSRVAERKIPEAIRSGVIFDPVTGAPSGPNVARIIATDYFRSESKRGWENVIIKYRTESHGDVKRWISPEGSSGAVWHAKKFAASRGIRGFKPSAQWLLTELKLSIGRGPSHLIVKKNERGFLEVDCEIFPLDDSTGWGGVA